MKRLWIILSGILLLSLTKSEAQTYVMGSTGANVTTCSGTFFDSGGAAGNYDNGENLSVTFSSGDPTKVIVFDFTFWRVNFNSNCTADRLEIYDGTNSGAPLLGRYCLNAPPRRVSSSGESLHFVFVSNGSGNTNGWEATISCEDLPCETAFYKDEFAAAQYNLTNGTADWSSTSWIEVNDNGNPNSGVIEITGGELEIKDLSGGSPKAYIERAVDLTGATAASLSYDYREEGNLENSSSVNWDLFYIEVYDGSTWNIVQEVQDDFPGGTAQIDITPYANADTRIRFRVVEGFLGSDETIYFDNVTVCFTSSGGALTDFYLEAECGYVGSSWSILDDPDASELLYVEPRESLNSLASAPADTLDYLTYEIDIDSTGDYEIFGRVIAPTVDDDSFWVRVNAGTWYRWNNLSVNATWTWLQVWDSDNGDTPLSWNLIEGTTARIDIAYREDGTQLDKLYITIDDTVPPTGLGDDSVNCPDGFIEDTDGDGIADIDDLDDDNDGIPDIFENPATISFRGTRTLLVGTNESNLQVGDKVLYADAIRDCDNLLYDVVLTITARVGVTIDADVSGFRNLSSNGSSDDYSTFTIQVVESGSATVGNPTGTPATIDDFTFIQRDVDSSNGDDITEVVGVSNATPPDMISLTPTTNLEQAGFVNGGGPANFTLYRLIDLGGGSPFGPHPALGGIDEEDPDYGIFLFYENFSLVEFVFGLTGSDGSNRDRITRYAAEKECDFDNDGISNDVDLDSDNDGIFDLHESGHAELDIDNNGRIDDADISSGSNGLFDDIETSPESGNISYTVNDTDGDLFFDFTELDSDDDSCFDSEEADVSDPDNDGVASSGTPAVDINGLVISIVYVPPPSVAWQDPTQTCLEICDNGEDDDGDGLTDDEDPDCANYFLEAECGFPGSNWIRGFDVLASNDDFLTISPGLNSIVMPPGTADDLVRFTVNVAVTGLYRILGRVYSADGADDSFWVRVDEGIWYNWNDWNTAATWQWLPVQDNDNGNTLVKWTLTPGNHTIDIAYREDGARFDKLHLTINGTTPTGLGEDAINCGRRITYNLFIPALLLNK